MVGVIDFGKTTRRHEAKHNFRITRENIVDCIEKNLDLEDLYWEGFHAEEFDSYKWLMDIYTRIDEDNYVALLQDIDAKRQIAKEMFLAHVSNATTREDAKSATGGESYVQIPRTIFNFPTVVDDKRRSVKSSRYHTKAAPVNEPETAEASNIFDKLDANYELTDSFIKEYIAQEKENAKSINTYSSENPFSPEPRKTKSLSRNTQTRRHNRKGRTANRKTQRRKKTQSV